MTDPVPAVTEADATGETAVLFADIRDVYGVSTVNLVWRHLATMPGALAHVWGGLRPLYLDGTVAREAATLRDELWLPPVARLTAAELLAYGLDALSMNGVRQVLAAYDRTNAMALVALCAARARLAGTPAPVWQSGATPPPAGPAFVLPQLLDLDTMPRAVAEGVVVLNRVGSRKSQPLLASMYRQLAHWPPFLSAAARVLLGPHLEGGAEKAVAMALAQARIRGGALPRVAGVPPLRPGMVARVDRALALFTGDPIVRMVVVTRMLRSAVG